MMFGVLDTQDDLWLGDTKGAFFYDDEKIAEAAARILDARLGWKPGRCRARPMEAGVETLRDELEPKRTGEEALRLLENGLIF